MATKIGGVGGGVTMPTGFNGHFRGFSGEIGFPEAVTTGFTDLGFASAIPVGGIRNTGSVSGVLVFDSSTTQPIPDALADGSGLALGDLASCTGTLTLTITTGCTLAGSHNITSLGYSRQEDAEATGEWRYGSSGALTIVWDETT